MYKVRVGETIEKGDIIAIAHSNDISVGIYYGRGSGGTVQYYYPGAVTKAKDNYENRVLNHGIEKVGPFKLGSIWKAYINTPRDTRIMKLNRENITFHDDIEDIKDAKEILKQFNIHVNY